MINIVLLNLVSFSSPNSCIHFHFLVLIVSGVLGSICAVLLLLLLYLIRAVRRKNHPRHNYVGRNLPPGVIVQDHIPQYMPETIPHRVQSPVSSTQPFTAEQLDTRNYGPDMSKFFGHPSKGRVLTFVSRKPPKFTKQQ